MNRNRLKNNLVKLEILLNLQPQNQRSVAQLVEHVTLNHGVEGSSPSGPTTFFQIPHALWDFLFWENYRSKCIKYFTDTCLAVA